MCVLFIDMHKITHFEFWFDFFRFDLPYKFSDTCGSFLRVTDTYVDYKHDCIHVIIWEECLHIAKCDDE